MVDVLMDVTVQKERYVYATTRARTALFVESFQAVVKNIRLLYSKAWKRDTRKGRINRITKKTERTGFEQPPYPCQDDDGLKLEIKTIFFLSLG